MSAIAMPAKYPVTVVGEALVDLVTPVGAARPTAFPGGSPANVALGLARLGVPPALITQLGADPHGDLIREHLHRNGVHVVPAGPADAPTSTATAILDATGAASYEFALRWQVRDLTAVPGSRALHVGSLGTTLSPGDEAVVALVDRVSAAGEALISYDPNLRPALIADPATTGARVDRLAAASDIVKLSVEDLELLTGRTDPSAASDRWLRPGGRTRLVVVTLGADGAYAATAQRSLRVPPYRVRTVDTVGAGDTFTAGLLAALADLDALDPAALPDALATAGQLDRILATAAAAAAITCSRPGADPPTTTELATFLTDC